jgi:osmotically-inducible protein OsmY
MRTDYEVQQDVMDELQYEPSIDAAQIGVSSKNGVVTLSGTVKTYAEKESAAWTAERVSGVKAVVDEIKIQLLQAHERSDQDIAMAALQALEWHVQVPHTCIKMKVERGIITLEGDVDYRYEKIAAENAVRNLTGVLAVVNLINVKPVATPSEVKVQIANALRRAAEVDARKIKIEVRDDKVILRGRVRSWAERNEAERAAWAAPGVREVEDDLTVAA